MDVGRIGASRGGMPGISVRAGVEIESVFGHIDVCPRESNSQLTQTHSSQPRESRSDTGFPYFIET